MSVDLRNCEGYKDMRHFLLLNARSDGLYVHSGRSSISAHPMQETSTGTLPLPGSTRVLLLRPVISLSRRTCCSLSS